MIVRVGAVEIKRSTWKSKSLISRVRLVVIVATVAIERRGGDVLGCPVEIVILRCVRDGAVEFGLFDVVAQFGFQRGPEFVVVGSATVDVDFDETCDADGEYAVHLIASSMVAVALCHANTCRMARVGMDGTSASRTSAHNVSASRSGPSWWTVFDR